MVKKAIGFVLLLLVVVIIGCGGGGGGGGNGGGNGGNNGGDTGADPNSTIVGRIVRDDTGTPISTFFPRIKFYDINGALVGTATARSTGWFDALIPSSAVEFQVDPTSIPDNSGYLRLYRYNGHAYSAPEITCKTALPQIQDGVQTQLPVYIRLVTQTQTPPFPDGCSL